MDPFRDELRVAHERIAQLERENAELRGARPKPERVPSAKPGLLDKNPWSTAPNDPLCSCL